MRMYVFLALLLFSGTLFADGLRSGSCGRRPGDSRIVGGNEATPNSWPWQLSLRHRGFHNCGASLINPQWAVTAAHCVTWDWNKPLMYSVRAGAHNRDKDGEEYRVNKIIIHRNYNFRNHQNDIALLRLAIPVKMGPTVGTVCLPPKGSRIKPGTRCWIAGWGRISSSSNHVADRLKQSLVPVVDQRTCARKNGANVHEDSMVCVGGSGSSACHGDSGGPLMCEEGSGHWVLRGAASWVSHKTCPKDGYTVYARVSSYIDWINSQIASMS